MRFIILLFVIFASVKANGQDCERHPIYCNIVDKKPKISPKYAMYMSNLIYKYSKKYKQDAKISIAIGMQETRLRQINRRQNIIIFNDDNTSWKIVKGYTDLCMYQFHVDTIVSHNLDPIKLKDDVEYCVEQHFILLRQKRKLCKHLKEDSWVCYHSINKVPREYYKHLVKEYF